VKDIREALKNHYHIPDIISAKRRELQLLEADLQENQRRLSGFTLTYRREEYGEQGRGGGTVSDPTMRLAGDLRRDPVYQQLQQAVTALRQDAEALRQEIQRLQRESEVLKLYLTMLDAEHRQVIELRYRDGRQILDLTLNVYGAQSLNTVEKRLHRAEDALLRLVDAQRFVTLSQCQRKPGGVTRVKRWCKSDKQMVLSC
jgi:hypothetical protein